MERLEACTGVVEGSHESENKFGMFHMIRDEFLFVKGSNPPPQNCTKNRASWDSRFFVQFLGGAPPPQNCTKLPVREELGW